MTPYLVRLLDITMNNNAIQGGWKKSYSGCHVQRGRSIDSSTLQTGQINHGGLQVNGPCYSRVSETSLGNDWLVI